MKKLITTIILILVAFMIYWIASPYWAVYQIFKAVEQNQPETVVNYIDFPSVRENLKVQIEQKIAKKIGLSNSNNNYASLGHKLNHFISNQMVDVVVTPETIMLLLQGKSLHESYFESLNDLINPLLAKRQQVTYQNISAVTTYSAVHTLSNEKENEKPKGAFHAWNKFVVNLSFKNQHKIEIVLQPKNGTWKVVDMYLLDGGNGL